MFVLVLQKLFLEAIFDIVYFPLWWYTAGAKHALLWCLHLFLSGNRRLAPGLWLKNIFVPMFGQYDWQGRIISFFMRTVQIVARTAALLIWLGVCVGLFLSWIALPIIVLYGLFAGTMKKPV